MTLEERHAHCPPLPPEPLIAAVLAAATALCDQVKAEFAACGRGDEIAERLRSKVDALDDALKVLAERLKRGS